MKRKLVYKIIPGNHLKKYLKKLKDKKLNRLFVKNIYTNIADDPKSGVLKKETYRIAYLIKNDTVILVILGGPHEGFYAELKRIVANM